MQTLYYIGFLLLWKLINLPLVMTVEPQSGLSLNKADYRKPNPIPSLCKFAKVC